MANTFQRAASLPSLEATRQDLYTVVETLVPQEALVDLETLRVVSGKLAAALGVPRTVKVQLPYTDFAAAGTQVDVVAYALPEAPMVYQVKIKPSVQFDISGIAMSALTFSVGVDTDSPDPDSWIDDWDGTQAVSDTNMKGSGTVAVRSFTHGAGRQVIVRADATGGNLNTLTQGMLDVWIVFSQAI